LERLAIRHKAVGLSLETTLKKRLPLKVFAFDDGTQPYGFHGTFKRLLAAAGLSKDMSSGQERTLYSLRHTYATMELLSPKFDTSTPFFAHFQGWPPYESIT
jgi:integrase